MQITTIGIDLAKMVFAIHGVDKQGKAVLQKQLKRGAMKRFFSNLEPCLIGMEACGSAHHWARELEEFGHCVKLMAAQFVKPYRNGPRILDSRLSVFCPHILRPDHAATGHITLPS
jgi:transposase